MTSIPTWVHRHIDNDVLATPGRYTSKHRTFSHVALLFRGRRLIAIGQNRLGRRGNFHTIHAEADVIRSLGDLSKLKGMVLVVIRIESTGLQNSKPCHACQCLLEKCMREYGLRGYYHS
jgi:hypothetical protein